AAQNNDSPPCGINGCMIWWDGQFSPTEQVWLRKTFVLDGPIVSAYIQGGADDDATIWVNGNVIYDVFDGLAGPFGPIDIAPYLVPGNNLIAVFGDDNFAFGPNHQFAARLTIETAATAVAVPVMSPPVSMLAGLLLLAIGIYSLRSRVAYSRPAGGHPSSVVLTLSNGPRVRRRARRSILRHHDRKPHRCSMS